MIYGKSRLLVSNVRNVLLPFHPRDRSFYKRRHVTLRDFEEGQKTYYGSLGSSFVTEWIFWKLETKNSVSVFNFFLCSQSLYLFLL